MEFGIAYPARLEAWKDLVRAEELGFSSAWFYDSQMLYSDVYAGLAQIAVQVVTDGRELREEFGQEVIAKYE